MKKAVQEDGCDYKGKGRPCQDPFGRPGGTGPGTVGKPMDIAVKAGEKIIERIRDGGFRPDRIAAYVGPGAGPRWLVSAGFDLTLLREGTLGRKRPVVLSGASAGALRFAAWVQPEAEKCYRALMDGYIGLTFDDRDNRKSVGRKILDLIDGFVENDAIPFALAHKRYRLNVVTARARRLAAREMAPLQGTGLLFASLLNAVHRSWLRFCFERVVFFTGPIPPRYAFRKGFRGRTVPLNAANYKLALLASSAIPLAVSGVRNPFGAPPGVYRDGGLVDYHLNTRFGETDEDVTLFFSHQGRIVPTWLDKRLSYRRPRKEALENVLMIHPTEAFVEALPGGRVPEREDFRTFWKDPGQRMENWRRAVEMSSRFGENFLELVESGKIREIVTPLGGGGK